MENESLDAPSTYTEEQQAKLGSVAVEVEQNTYTLEELWQHKDDIQRFLIDELIPDASVTVLIGEDGIGKTQILTQLCLSVCLKFKTFMTLPLSAQHHRCLIVATEDSRQKFTKAIVKQAKALKPDLKPKDVDIRFTEGSNFDALDDLVNEIKRLLKANPYDVVVIDAMSDLFTMIDGEINSNSHARKILSKLQNLCNTYQTAIILIHHAAKSKIFELKKAGTIFITKDSSQGAGAITQKPRTVLALSNHKDSTSPDGRFYDNYLHVVKANLMGKQYMTNAIQLQFDGTTLCHTFTQMQNIEEWEMQNAPENGNGQMPSFQQQLSRQQEALKPQNNATVHEMFVRDKFPDGAQYSGTEVLDQITAYYAIGMTQAKDTLKQLIKLQLVENHAGVYVKQGDAPF